MTRIVSRVPSGGGSAEAGGGGQPKNKENKIKFEIKATDKDSYEYQKRNLRHIRGKLEDPTSTPEKYKLNKATVATLKGALFTEYKYCHDVVQNSPTLIPVLEKVHTKQTLTPADVAVVNAAGLSEDQLLFYIDFTGGGVKLDTDDAILSHADEWRKDDDKLMRTLQLAEDQLSAYQRSGNADIASRSIKPKIGFFNAPGYPYETAGPYAFGDESEQVTMDQMEKRTNVAKRILQNTQQKLNERGFNKLPIIGKRITPNDEALLRRAVQSREGVQKLIDEADPHTYYDGVRYFRVENGQMKLVARGVVELKPQTRYEKFLLNADKLPNQVLLDAQEMTLFEKRITNIVDARIDFYRQVSDRGEVEPKVFKLEVDPASPTGFRITRNVLQHVTDIEREFAGNPAQQRSELQKRISAEAQKKLQDQEKVRKAASKNEELGEQVRQWKTELADDTPQNKEKIEAAKKILQDQIDAKNKEKMTGQKKEDLEKRLEETKDQLDEVEKRTGLTRVDIEAYDKSNTEIQARNGLIEEQQEFIDHWQKQLSGIKIPTVPTVDPKTGIQTLPEDINSYEYKLAFGLQQDIEKANGTIIGYKQNIRKFNSDKKDIIEKYRRRGLTDTEMETAYATWTSDKQTKDEISGFTAFVGGSVSYGALQSTEAIQKEIDSLQKQKDEVGADRIEEEVIKMLDTFEALRTDETNRNVRLEQHELGTLADIPDFAHLAGYPRVYLRTIQILFPNVSFMPDNEVQLKSFMKLFPMEDFVRIAGPHMNVPRFDMYDPGWNTYQDVLMERIDDKLMTNIVDDLSERIRKKNLGLTPLEKTIHDNNLKIRNEHEAHPISDNAKVRLRAFPTFMADVSTLANAMYYYDNVDDLTRRIIAMSGIPLTQSNMRQTHFVAEEVMQYRKEHPNI